MGLEYDEERQLLQVATRQRARMSFIAYLGLATHVTAHAAYRVHVSWQQSVGGGARVSPPVPLEIKVLYLGVLATYLPAYLIHLALAIWQQELVTLFNVLVHENQNPTSTGPVHTAGSGSTRERFLGYAHQAFKLMIFCGCVPSFGAIEFLYAHATYGYGGYVSPLLQTLFTTIHFCCTYVMSCNVM